MSNVLMEHELEILRSVPESGIARPYAYAVWVDREGAVQMGPVRRRVPDGETYKYECSPFPGAWDWHVPESAVVRVRHLGALCLSNAACVCRGTEWDRHCPSQDCTTAAR